MDQVECVLRVSQKSQIIEKSALISSKNILLNCVSAQQCPQMPKVIGSSLNEVKHMGLSL